MSIKAAQLQLILFSIIGVVLLYIYKANIFFILVYVFFIISINLISLLIKELYFVNENIYIENIFLKQKYYIDDIIEVNKLFFNFYKITVKDKTYLCYSNKTIW